MIAALFVEKDGVYYGLDNIDPWDQKRDARCYDGPHPVIAHPPCARWGKYWFGSPLNPVHKKGDDNGCFAAALAAVRKWGGVLEHPAYSHAWRAHGLPWPQGDGWQRDIHGGWCCHVDQYWYGHYASKPTWLYVVGGALPSLKWEKATIPLNPVMVERHGMKKARRFGNLSWRGGGSNVAIRSKTPPEFRDLLVRMIEGTAP